MKNKKKMVILVIELLALIVFVLSYKSYSDSVVKPIKVYQFARTINEGTEIKQQDLKLVEVAANTYSDNMILQSDISSIVGKYTTAKVYEGTLCYDAQFGDLNESNSLFASLDLSNARLMSLKVDMTDVAGNLAPGDRIDLMFTGGGTANLISINPSGSESSSSASNEQQGQENETTSESFVYSKIFLQDVVIYDVIDSAGYKYVNKANRYAGDAPTGINAADVVTADSGTIANLLLVISPEEAEEIKTRELTGNITVVKRFDESETHDTLGYIIGNYGKLFSGHANAETSSLQIISTIQDTDMDDEKGADDKQIYNTTGGNGSNNAQKPEENKDTNNGATGLLGGLSLIHI